MAEDQPGAPERLSELLASVEADPRLMSSRRAAIRAGMLEAFDAEKSEASGTIGLEGGPSIEVVDLDRPDVGGETATTRGRVVLVAACLVVIAGLALLALNRETDTSTEVAAAVPLAPGSVELPFALAPQGYVTDAVGGGVRFDVPDGLVLVRLDSGFIRFDVVDSNSDDPSYLTLQDTVVSAEELADSIGDWKESGDVVATSTPRPMAAGETERWRLQLPETFFCAEFPECSVPPVLRDENDPPRLRQSASVYLTILEVTERSVLLVEYLGDGGDVAALAADTISSSITIDR